MRVALVIPPWLPEDIFPTRTAKSQVNYWQPLGVLYIASYLIQEGHEVEFFDGSFNSLQEVRARAEAFKPHLIGIYANAPLWKKALKTAQELREVGSAFMAVGGPYPTARKEECLENGVDAVVIGEGEIPFANLAKRLERGESLEGLRGIAFRREGKKIRNPPQEPVENLDTLPFPARDLLEDRDLYVPPEGTYREKPVAIVMTSRGCDRKCIFCSQIDPQRRIRFRSVENVLEEIEQLLEEGYREIRFLDDNFAADYHRAMRIVEGIKKRGLKFSWYFSSRVDTVDEKLFRECKEAGAWGVFLGAESGVQKNLNALRKGITLEETERAVKGAKKAGLNVTLPFILGIPGESYEEALKTIEFAIKLDPDVVNFHTMTPFPGTELYERAGELGSIEGSLEEFTYEGAAFVPRTMTREQIEELRRLAFTRFYSRPRFIIKKLLGVRSLSELRAIARGMKSLFWIALKEDALRIKRKLGNS